MKPFMDADFLLQTDTAKILYHEAAEKMPIFDYHNHLNPQEILEDRQMENLTRVWLGGDHYKWRAMRAMGFSEDLITGNADDYDKYLAFAETIENAIGNPLYHWTHLELQRYFGITTPLSRATAKEIWDEANAKLQTKEFTVRNLILNQHVSHLCTTDDPADDLHCHLALQKEDFACRVLPSFRPDRAVHLEKPDFPEYVEKLATAAGRTIASAEDMVRALSCRLDFFLSAGCVVSDHSLEGCFYVPCTAAEANAVFKNRMNGGALTEKELDMYKGFLLTNLGRLYHKHNIAMQLHIKALRNNSKRMFRALGADTGFDSMNDFAFAPMLGAFLNDMDEDDALPKTVLYSLNPGDNPMLASMARKLCCAWHPLKSAVRYRMVVQRSQIRHEIPACDAFQHRHALHLHRHADRLPQLPLLPAPRIFPPDSLQSNRKPGGKRGVPGEPGVSERDGGKYQLQQCCFVFPVIFACLIDNYSHIPYNKRDY